MPTELPISKEFHTFQNGTTASAKTKRYSVCLRCGFRDGIRDEAHILERGKLGCARTSKKFNHLQKCSVVSDDIRKKYDKNGLLVSL